MTPIDSGDRHGRDAPIGRRTAPGAIAITPDGTTVYVADYGANTVTPIDTATEGARDADRRRQTDRPLAITPDGKTPTW